jgi:hypothetical protein
MVRQVLALALVTVLGLGCFVFDELDAAENLLDSPSFSNEKTKQPGKPRQPDPPPQPEAAPEKRLADRPSVGEWWKKTRSLSSGEVSDEFVKCELGGKTQFMRRPDCLARGGTPRSAGS